MANIPTLQPCRRKCDWKTCDGHYYLVHTENKGKTVEDRWVEYYEMSEIWLCRYQVAWIIEEFIRYQMTGFEVMRDMWPSSLVNTGYTEAPPTQHSVRAHAPWESMLQIVGEVRARLENTGKDGHELALMLENGRRWETLSEDARFALGYVNGWWRKRTDYSAWKAMKKYRQPDIETYTNTIDRRA